MLPSSGYKTITDVSAMLSSSGYKTITDVSAMLPSAGYKIFHPRLCAKERTRTYWLQIEPKLRDEIESCDRPTRIGIAKYWEATENDQKRSYNLRTVFAEFSKIFGNCLKLYDGSHEISCSNQT